MIHYAKTTTTKQLYNLLVSIYTAPNDYIAIYSYGVFVGWSCKAAFLTPELGSSELDKIMTFAKEIEKGRRKQLMLQNLA